MRLSLPVCHMLYVVASMCLFFFCGRSKVIIILEFQPKIMCTFFCFLFFFFDNIFEPNALMLPGSNIGARFVSHSVCQCLSLTALSFRIFLFSLISVLVFGFFFCFLVYHTSS